ncbi:MAG: hypothetical protein AVDCRST_MAG16-417, partial [uncultured Frankineae bacterium]
EAAGARARGRGAGGRRHRRDRLAHAARVGAGARPAHLRRRLAGRRQLRPALPRHGDRDGGRHPQRLEAGGGGRRH